MNEDELRAVLRAEADAALPGAESFDRLHQRLAGPQPKPILVALGPAVAILVLVALTVGLVVAARRGASDRHRSPVAGRPMPGRIAAVTNDSRLVVLDSHTGQEIRTLAENVGTFRGAPDVAASPDGSILYYTAIDPARPPGCLTTGQETVYRVSVAGGPAGMMGRGRTLAVSSHGGELAFSRDYEVCTSGAGVLQIDGPHARDLRMPSSDPRRQELSLSNLGWSRDGRLLAFDRADPVPHPYVIQPATASSIEDARCLCRAPEGLESFGFLGGTRQLIAGTASGATARYAENAVVLGDDGSVDRTLFRWRAAINGLASDASGRHILMVSPTKRTANGKGYVDVLYRWSRGDRHPVKVRDGVVAATWIPDARPSAPSVAAVRSDGRLAVWPTPSSEAIHDVTTLPDVSQIAAVPNGAGIVAGVDTSSACAYPNDPHIERVNLGNGTSERVASGRFPVVSGTGLMAYEVRCDGVTLGTTDLGSGANTRSNPIGDSASEASPRVQLVRPVAFSPDGTQLLYAVAVRGAGQRWYVGRVSAEGFLDHRPRRLPFDERTTLTFLDDRHLAVAFYRHPYTTVRSVTLPPRRGGRVQVGAPIARFRGAVIRMSVDPSGRWFLAVVRGGVLVSWRRGGAHVGQIVGNVESATWVPSQAGG